MEIRDFLYCSDTDPPVEEISDLPDEDTPPVEENPDFQNEDDQPDDEIDETEPNFEPIPQDTRDPQGQRKEITFTKEDVLDFVVDNRKHVITGRKLYDVPWHSFLQFNNIWLTNTQRPIHASLYKLQNFGRLDDNKFSIEKYPYAVALTRMYAGLGDYDKNFAHITFYKDEMLAIENLNFRGDFRGVSDFQNESQKFSDSFLYAEYKFHDFSFSMNYLNFDRQLNSFYYYFEDYGSYIDEVWNIMNFEVTWKSLFVSYFSGSNKYSAAALGAPVRFDTKSLAVGVDLNFDIHRIRASGQHDFDDNLFNLQYSLLTEDYMIKTDGVFFDDGSKIYANADIKASLNKNLYLLGKAHYRDIVRPKIYFSIENHLRNSYEGGVGYKSFPKGNFYFDTYMLAGKKELTQYFASKTTEDVYTVSHVFDVNYILHNILFNIHNKFEYNNFSNYIYLLSDYYNEVDASITMNLKNDNRIILGSKVSLISSIFNEKNYIIPMNHCIDVYLSIGITKLFDIKAEINNLTRRGHFGNESLGDMHFTAQMVWYFIN